MISSDKEHAAIVEAKWEKNRLYYDKVKTKLHELYDEDYVLIVQQRTVFHSKYERPCLKYLADNVSPEDKLGYYLVRIGHEDCPRFQGAVIAGRIVGEDDSDGIHYGVKLPIEVRATGSKNFRSVD
jgi:hypothetical protein